MIHGTIVTLGSLKIPLQFGFHTIFRVKISTVKNTQNSTVNKLQKNFINQC